MPDILKDNDPAIIKKTLLVVEDEFINREILNMILSGYYDVLFAENGSEAIEILNSRYETLSLVLLDLNLPDMHGLEVLKKIKSDKRLVRVPVIVMTAEKDAEVESLREGAIDFIPKPYPQPEIILARILRIIELSEDRDIIRLTERDQLTDLYNKDFFYLRAGQYDLYHSDICTDAIVIDINHFHMINERYGKDAGDNILKKIASCIKKMVHETGGIVGRKEADTFLIYCPHGLDYSKVLDTVAASIDEGINSDNKIHARIGVYESTDRDLEIEQRFDRAKLAADTVKGNYIDPIGIYDDSLHEKEVFEEQLIEKFHTAIKEKQFCVYFQPKFNIKAEVPILASAEALVRWKHPDTGLISPGIFVPLFEKNGLIRELDNFVWKETGAQIRKWKDDLGITLPVSINVSRVDIYDPSLTDKLKEIIDTYNLSFEDMILEITESAYTEDSAQIIETVQDLRNMGFRIEMDDFGSGYSSLNMLSDLPVDALKLDMQFIRNAFKEKRNTRLLEIIIKLAEALNVPTIAEGVETLEQLSTLRSMGCDIAQGYYFSKPLPADEFEEYIKEHISK